MARPTDAPKRWAYDGTADKVDAAAAFAEIGFVENDSARNDWLNWSQYTYGEWLTYLSDLSATRTVDLVVNPSWMDVYLIGSPSPVTIIRTDDDLAIVNGSGSDIDVRMRLDLTLPYSAYATAPSERVLTLTAWKIYGKTSGGGTNAIDATIYRKTLVSTGTPPNVTTSINTVSGFLAPAAISGTPYGPDPAGRTLLPAVLYGGASYYMNINIDDGTTFEFAELRLTCTMTDV